MISPILSADSASINPTDLLTPQVAADLAGVSVQTIRLWDRADKIECVRSCGNHRRVIRQSLLEAIGMTQEASTDSRSVVSYARTSTHSQATDRKQGDAKDGCSDLSRQCDRLTDYVSERYPHQDHIQLSDVGSGLKEDRKNFLRLISMICAGEVSTVVVWSKDRLARFGTTMFEKICEANNCEFVIVDREEKDMSFEESLAVDILSLTTCFSAKLYGMRGGNAVRVIVTEEAKARMIELRQLGYSYKRIESQIEQEGFRSNFDQPYKDKTIRDVIYLDVESKKAIEQPQDLMDEWIEESCVKEEDSRTPTCFLFKSYSEFLSSRGIPAPIHRNFTKGMMAKGFTRCQLTNRKLGYNGKKSLKGLRLR